jgi:hypothetical protein
VIDILNEFKLWFQDPLNRDPKVSLSKLVQRGASLRHASLIEFCGLRREYDLEC